MKSIVREALNNTAEDTADQTPGSESNIIVAQESHVKAIESVARPERKAIKGKGLMTDEELQKTLEQVTARVKVVGCGGSGNNTMSRMGEIGIHGAELVALNTDAQHLLITPADKKVLIGRELTKGLGAGSNPEIGEAACRESMEDVASVLENANLVFITCGLGGGTGSGSAPVIAEIGKEIGALTVGIVTLPFSVEGKKRMQNALFGLKKLQKNADTVIVVPNDKLLEIVPELPLNAAFKVADEVLSNATKGITELITKPGLVNLDFADIRTILTDGGSAMIGLGESNADGPGEGRALEAIEEALNSPLLDIDVSNANRALINVIGGPSMTLKEAEVICEAVASKIHQDSHIIWGAMINEDMPKNMIKAMVLIAGGTMPYLDAETGELKGPELDLKFVKE